MFFVISGWLVDGSLLNKIGQRDAIANFAIDRVSRLWTVLIPTFVLALLIGLNTGLLNAHGIDFSAANPYSALAFAGNLLGLQTVILDNFFWWGEISQYGGRYSSTNCNTGLMNRIGLQL